MSTDPFAPLRAALPAEPLAQALMPVLTGGTGLSSAGFPYLQPGCHARLRDTIPVILAWGPAVIAGTQRVVALAERSLPPGEALESLRRAAQVIGQVTRTAAITAPSDLWLLRHVLSVFDRLGLRARLLAGERLRAEDVRLSDGRALLPKEILPDLELLYSRGLLLREADEYYISGHNIAQRVWTELRALPADEPAGLSGHWSAALRGETPHAALAGQVDAPPSLGPWAPGCWFPTPEAITLGARLLPLVLALRAEGRLAAAVKRGALLRDALRGLPAPLIDGALGLFEACGVLAPDRSALSATGGRTLGRAPGPMGIIEAYWPYLEALPQILTQGRGGVHLRRGTNIAASQDANRGTFRAANDALDRLCADTGFTYSVFVEHAIGHGEATRQRLQRSGPGLTYVGADLEDATIDAAIAQQAAGHLPADMRFVRHADIGQPHILVDAMREMGVQTEAAVMVVGNGFHEVRGADDRAMVEVFAGYERAGLLLLFTEESALSTRDLLETAWNTYHAGFRYVHARSGQGLRPADPSPPGHELPASWTECAEAAGYVRLDDYCSRSRTIYPIPPEGRHNPSISVNHFFAPRRVAEALGVV